VKLGVTSVSCLSTKVITFGGCAGGRASVLWVTAEQVISKGG
jgi:hypothetical protein